MLWKVCFQTARPLGLTGAVMPAGAAVDEMVELLCANLQKDELAALNTSMTADGVSQKQQQDLVKVHTPSQSPPPCAHSTSLTCTVTVEDALPDG